MRTTYERFTSLISKCAKYLRQTDLAFLTPPKLRTKGRFLSISKLGKWGIVMAVKGRVKKGSIQDRLRKVLPGLGLLKPYTFCKQCKNSITNYGNS